MEKQNNSIQPIINEYLRKEKEENKHDSKYFHASSLGSCKRKQIWTILKVPETNPLDDRMLRVFSVGNVFHEWLQDKLAKAGVLIAKEQEVINEKYNYKGRFDALVKIENKNILYDFKTQHSKSFHYIKNNNEGVDEGKKLQVVSYAVMGNIKVDECRILFISKDDLCFLEYIIPIEPYKKKVIDELVELNVFLKTKKLPPALPEKENGKPNWQCGYCRYLDKCRGKNWSKK